MADEAPIELPVEQPAFSRHYALLSLLMLVVITVLLLERIPDVWSAFPLLIGVAFLALQWREGPPFVLVILGWLMAAKACRFDHFPPELLSFLLSRPDRFLLTGRDNALDVSDFLLAAAFLVYAASYYRYLGFVRHIFPLDSRRRAYGGLGSAARRRILEEPFRRSPATGTPREFALLFAAAAVSVGAAAYLWSWSPPERRMMSMEPVVWWGVKLLWLFGSALVLLRAALSYANRARASASENLLFLQEQLWRETRREQSRVNRWLTWARLRAQRWKEKP